MSLGWIDQVVLYGYLLGIVAFGCYFSRHNRTTRSFMDAGGSLAGWVVGLSIFGTYLSSISFLANPGKSFSANWNPFVFSLSLPLAAWIAGKWFVPFYRAAHEVSAYAHLERRFGRWAKNYAILCFVLTQTVRIGAVLLLVALAVQPITDIGIAWIILGLGIAVIVYTLLGGIEAVIWTDVIQSIVLTIGILVAIGFIVAGMPGGLRQVIEIAKADGKFSWGSWSLTLLEPTVWVVLLYGLFINLQNFGIDQSYVQRYATAVDEKSARRSVWMACHLYLPVSGLLFFVGTGLYAFYQIHPELAPDSLAGDQAFAHFIAHQLPTGCVGLLVAAIMAAAMSSVDSSLNSCATLICADVAPQFLSSRQANSSLSERTSWLVLVTATVVIGLLGIAVALMLIGTESILDAWWKLAGIFSGGLLGLFLLGLLSRQVTGRQALGGVILGIVLIAWMTLSPLFFEGTWLAFPWHPNLIIVIGTLAIVVFGFGCSWLLGGK